MATTGTVSTSASLCTELAVAQACSLPQGLDEPNRSYWQNRWRIPAEQVKHALTQPKDMTPHDTVIGNGIAAAQDSEEQQQQLLSSVAPLFPHEGDIIENPGYPMAYEPRWTEDQYNRCSMPDDDWMNLGYDIWYPCHACDDKTQHTIKAWVCWGEKNQWSGIYSTLNCDIDPKCTYPGTDVDCIQVSARLMSGTCYFQEHFALHAPVFMLYNRFRRCHFVKSLLKEDGAAALLQSPLGLHSSLTVEVRHLQRGMLTEHEVQPDAPAGVCAPEVQTSEPMLRQLERANAAIH